MKLKIYFLILIFPCIVLSLSANEGSEPARDRFEEIAGRGFVINTSPTGARVYIDGIDQGISPVSINNIISGELHVRLTKEGFKERNFDITLFANSRLVVSIEMEELRGNVLISVNKTEGSPENLPFYPQIYTSSLDETNSSLTLSIDNKASLNLPVGYHTIRTRAFGWEDETVTLYIEENTATIADIFMKPAVFRIGSFLQSRKKFNPVNPNNLGITEYRFEVSAPGTADITITGKDGIAVFTKNFHLNESVQQITWNGRDDNGNPLPAGLYSVLIEASSITKETVQLELETEIDYSINIFPVTLLSGKSGLAFTPLPDVLPKGSYQIEAIILYGKFILPSDFTKTQELIFSGFPFGIGARCVFFNYLETSVFFNINPQYNNTGFGITGSVKYNVLGGDLPISLSAGISYTFANENGEAPLSPGRGIGIFAPFSTDWHSFKFILTPEIFWRGPQDFIPSILLSAGVLYSGGWFNAGVSMRTEFDFTENSGSPKLLAGAEGRFYPPPSNLFFSVLGGMWTKDSCTGGYGGVGIGLIY